MPILFWGATVFFILRFSVAVAAAPAISNVSSVVSTSTATVSWSTAIAADSQIFYGLDQNYGSSTANSSLLTSHSLSLAGLATGTVYHYMVLSSSSGETAFSGDFALGTLSLTSSQSPVIYNVSVAPSTGFLTFSWTTDEPANSTVNYGLTSSYGNIASIPTYATNHAIAVSGQNFIQGLTYHYNLSSTDGSGHTTATNDLTVAVTDNISMPTVASEQVISVGTSTATILWTTNAAALTGLDYGPSGTYASTTEASGLSTSHRTTLVGLQNLTSYSFRVILADGVNGKYTKNDVSYAFTTGPDTTPPTQSTSTVSNISMTTASIAWTTNEGTAAAVDYGTSTSYGMTIATATIDVSHSLFLTGLSPLTGYHYRIRSTDASGNVTTSTDAAFATLADTASMPLNQRVLILVNDAMPAEAGTGGVGASVYLGQHYAAARGIPLSNILHLTTVTAPSIASSSYYFQIQTPVQNFLEANGGIMKSKILYIVPMYGVPITTTWLGGDVVAVDTFLSSFYLPPSSQTNPYYSVGAMGSRPQTFAYWSDARTAQGLPKEFVVMRIDGPSAIISQREIDDAIAAEPTLTKKSGTGYFDIRDIYSGSPDGAGYNNVDASVVYSAAASVVAGFPTYENHQLVSGHMIQPTALYDYNVSSGVFINSPQHGSVTSSFSIPTLTSGTVQIALLGEPDGSPARVTATLQTPDPAKYAVFSEQPNNWGYPASNIEKFLGNGSSLKGFGLNQSLPWTSFTLTFAFSPGMCTMSYGTTTLVVLQDASGTALEFNKISLNFIDAADWLQGITVKDGSGNTVYADTFATNTTANYHWQTAPTQPQGTSTLWAYGWYSGDGGLSYSWEGYHFVPGSIGAQMTSYTAELVRSPFDSSLPQYREDRWWGSWVGRMLEDGVTATFGTVSEPYTSGYVKAHRLFDHFFAGYNFGDSYFMSEPEIPWTMVGIGDPLYAPQLFASSSQDMSAPAAPTNLVVLGTSTSTASLGWTASANAAAYYVYRNGAFLDVASGTSYADMLTPLFSAGYSASYQVTAVSKNGVESALAGPVTASFAGEYPTVSNVLVAASTTGATISWTTSIPVTALLSYGTSTTYTNGAMNYGTGVSHVAVLSGLSPSTTYHYQIFGADPAYAAFWNVTTNDATFTTGNGPAVSAIAVNASGTSATVSWNTDRLASARVDYGTSTALGAFVSTSTLATSASLTLTGLTQSTPYYYRITATDGSGNAATAPVSYFTTTGTAFMFQLNLQGASSTQLQKTAFALQFLDPSSGQLIKSVSVGSSQTGTISAYPLIAPQTVKVRVVVPGYLAGIVTSTVNLAAPSGTIALPTLSAGDPSGDNAVNALDASLINRNWNVNYPVGDYNHDGVVNASDLQYLENNWFMQGQ